MLDHLGLKVKDLKKSRAFYEAALKPLGYAVTMDFGQAIGMGTPQKPAFWLSQGAPAAGVHIAFEAKDRAAVAAFHKAAVAAGGKDNGAAGLREQYHPTYYGAFVLDPDGNNVEAVCHKLA